MLMRRWPVIFAVTAMICLPLAWWDSLAQPRHQPSQEQNYNGEGASDTDHAEGVKPSLILLAEWIGKWTRDDWNTASTITIAIFTVILGVGTIFLITTARSTARRQLRAYIFTDSVRVVESGVLMDIAAAQNPRGGIDPSIVRGQPGSGVDIKNTGQTPAYDVTHISDTDTFLVSQETNIPTPRRGDTIGSPRTVFGPNQGTTITRWVRVLTPIEEGEIRNRVRAIYVWGRIDYRDAFRRRRYTMYRLRYFGLWPPRLDATLTFCDTGNEAN